MQVTAILLPSAIAQSDYWSDPSKLQYHIQTDEGPDRYFRYQTLSGQYRKEKRLEDGTVIGTYGWVDADGIFRMRDYIADNAGYRILRTKNVYVGRNAPINEALNLAKKAPNEGGLLAKTTATTTPAPATTAYIPPSVGYNTNPRIPIGFNLVSPHAPVFKYATVPVTPDVQITLNGFPSTTESPLRSTPAPSSTILPPFTSTAVPSTTPATIYVPSTTVASTERPPSTTYGVPEYNYITPTTPRYEVSTIPPPISSNSLDFSHYSGDPQYEHYTDDSRRHSNPYIFRNGPTYPIDKNGNLYTGYTNNLGNGYDKQFPVYDGVSVTNDGFRYYLPKQYHEEQNLPGGQKAGSFGYIDPFGIRRVVYYNASPGGGFQHRKNNRYVGFNATPYDPRPY